jgi:hypothetical protein
MSGAIRMPAWRGAQLKHRDNFTFTFYFNFHFPTLVICSFQLAVLNFVHPLIILANCTICYYILPVRYLQFVFSSYKPERFVITMKFPIP